jgi:hypothetical protein
MQKPATKAGVEVKRHQFSTPFINTQTNPQFPTLLLTYNIVPSSSHLYVKNASITGHRRHYKRKVEEKREEKRAKESKEGIRKSTRRCYKSPILGRTPGYNG